ncbi:MAG: hypothetical protein ACRBCI_15115 [Cellvibrionaceae bacterium]
MKKSSLLLAVVLSFFAVSALAGSKHEAVAGKQEVLKGEVSEHANKEAKKQKEKYSALEKKQKVKADSAKEAPAEVIKKVK